MTPVVRPPAGRRQDRARAEVSARRATAPIVEQIVRSAMPRTTPALVERARTMLRRYFSDAPWRIDDDTALASIVGPGEGWRVLPIGHDLVVGFGWKAGSFRVEAELTDGATDGDAPAVATTPAPAPTPPTPPTAPPADVAAPPRATTTAAPAHATDLADTFEGPVVAEAQPVSRTVRFLTGAGTGGPSPGWIQRGTAGIDPKIAAVFERFPEVSAVMPGPGCFTIEVDDPAQWSSVLLPLLVHLGDHIATARVKEPDRQEERATAEFATFDPKTPRGIAKIRDALTSPDATTRQLAVTTIGAADPFAAERAWRAALDDAARNVRRAACRAMAEARRESLRPLLERAAGDQDACTRYHAVQGLAALGVTKSRPVLERLRRDGDMRVRLAVEQALRAR